MNTKDWGVLNQELDVIYLKLRPLLLRSSSCTIHRCRELRIIGFDQLRLLDDAFVRTILLPPLVMSREGGYPLLDRIKRE
jgi:hypothetical protein